MDIKKNVYIREHDNEKEYVLTEKMCDIYAPPQRIHGTQVPVAQSFGEDLVAHDLVVSVVMTI